MRKCNQVLLVIPLKLMLNKLVLFFFFFFFTTFLNNYLMYLSFLPLQRYSYRIWESFWLLNEVTLLISCCFSASFSNCVHFQDNISIADVLRQTANAFLCEKYLQGFEFQEDCQLYYNPVTGYYYDQVRISFLNTSGRI